jgi:hypothetical protein
MKKNVLVFPCGSEVGLEINRALAHSTHFTLIGANSVDDHGKFVYKNYVSGVPFIDDLNFISVLNLLIEEHNIDFIIPAHDSAVLLMAEHRHLINAVVITSSTATCQLTRSKKSTYELLKNFLPTPCVYNPGNVFQFPVFLKPDVGQGSRGTYKVNNLEELDFYLKKDPSLLILEYLPGKEFTIDCFTDRHGVLLFSEARERARISGGISVNSKAVSDPRFHQLAETINKHIQFQGVWFYQVKERQDGDFVLMEISPRVAGTMSLFRANGVNFIQLSLFDRMGFDVSVLNNGLAIEVDRALISRFQINENYDFVYIDFDDTIIVDNQVNSEAMQFLYQAKNLGKRIILISKHILNISESLNRFCISELLFDEIIILEKNERKSDYIVNLNAIFIDDSFAERKDVLDQLHIPVFSVDAISSLISWRV